MRDSFWKAMPVGFRATFCDEEEETAPHARTVRSPRPSVHLDTRDHRRVVNNLVSLGVFCDKREEFSGEPNCLKHREASPSGVLSAARRTSDGIRGGHALREGPRMALAGVMRCAKDLGWSIWWHAPTLIRLARWSRSRGTTSAASTFLYFASTPLRSASAAARYRLARERTK